MNSAKCQLIRCSKSYRKSRNMNKYGNLKRARIVETEDDFKGPTPSLVADHAFGKTLRNVRSDQKTSYDSLGKV